MKSRRAIAIRLLRRAAPAAAGVLLLGGCATAPLESARIDFFAGRLERADAALSKEEADSGKDRVLVLMERGTIRQARGDYGKSAADFIAASDRIHELETYSVSKGASSMVVNDTVENYRGAPYERTLLHVFAALDQLALANWDNGAVEARRMLDTLTAAKTDGYPEDAFSRYMAGFCLEMIDDDSNAAIQYRLASELAAGVAVDEHGRLSERAPPLPPPTDPDMTNAAPAAAVPPPKPESEVPRELRAKKWDHELVCFILLGAGPDPYFSGGTAWYGGAPAYAELYSGNTRLGRSYTLADADELCRLTAEREAARKIAKTVTRVAVKEGIAVAVEKSTDNELLGLLVRLVLIGMLEQPDVRRWETLPCRLQVARVPCPPDLKELKLVLQGGAGLTEIAVSQPITKRRRTYFCFYREMPAPWDRPEH